MNFVTDFDGLSARQRHDTDTLLYEKDASHDAKCLDIMSGRERDNIIAFKTVRYDKPPENVKFIF